MAREPDMELKQAFKELQEKMVDTTQQLKLADIKIESLRRSKARAELTKTEVATLPKDTKTYESVGRMFILESMDDVAKDLTTRSATADEKIKTLENNKKILERNLKDSENNLREMVQQRQKVNGSK